jgi:hypothetical protein
MARYFFVQQAPFEGYSLSLKISITTHAMKYRLFPQILTFLVLVYLFLAVSGEALGYYRGGEITWSCTPNGYHQFTMKLYRDCAGPGTFGDTLWIKSNAPGFDSIGMVRTVITDITPVCDCPAGAALSCATATQTGSGALEEHIYTSQAFFPMGVHLTGAPPPAGYYFVFEGCCRAPSANLAPGNSNFALRSVMYNYCNNNVSTCFDNTPVFKERPVVVACTGKDYWYIPFGADLERDSIKWAWTQPLLTMNTAVNAYSPGYSFLSPLPSQVHNPSNSQAILDPIFGDIVFCSYTSGVFVVATKATVYKAGIKVAEVLREMPVILISCPTNSAPGFLVNGQPVSGTVTDSVYAGTILNFSLVASDPDSCAGSGSSAPQTVQLSVYGTQFGIPMSKWGCLNPPCAMLSPLIHYDSTIAGSPSVQTTLSWQTGHQHLPDFTYHCPNCPWVTNYEFFFSVSDNCCPAPAKTSLKYRVVVIPKPQVPSPPVLCADLHPGGDLTLSWPEPLDTGALFAGYYLFSSTQKNGPYTLVNSLFAKGQTSITHSGTAGQLQPLYYLLQVRSDSTAGKPIPRVPYYTIQTLFLKVAAYDTLTGMVQLTWNPLRDNPLPGSVPQYFIQREYPASSWNIVGTTTGLSWSDTLPSGNKLVRYRVFYSDTIITSAGSTVCQSNSNIAELLVNVGIADDNQDDFSLGQNIPNPAGSTTTIPFSIAEPGEVTLMVHDINGKVVTQQIRRGHAGENTLLLDLSGYAPGIYSYSLHYRGAVCRKTMVVE